MIYSSRKKWKDNVNIVFGKFEMSKLPPLMISLSFAGSGEPKGPKLFRGFPRVPISWGICTRFACYLECGWMTNSRKKKRNKIWTSISINDLISPPVQQSLREVVRWLWNLTACLSWWLSSWFHLCSGRLSKSKLRTKKGDELLFCPQGECNLIWVMYDSI